MPFEMSYTDSTATNHPNSFWVIRYLGQNDPNKHGMITFMGYHDAASFFAGASEIGQHLYNVNDPSIYDLYFAQATYLTLWSHPYFTVLEGMASVLDDFFQFATQYSYLKASSIEIGSQGTSRVIVTFPALIKFGLGGNYTSGVTVKVNGVAATISAASRDADTVRLYYDLSAPVDADDVVTWEYDGAGFLQDAGNLPLHAFAAQAAVNTVGEYLIFSDPTNSAYVVLLLV